MTSLALALTAAPLAYRFLPRGDSIWSIDSLPTSLIACLAGLILLWLTPRSFALVGDLWAGFARLMLRRG